MGMVLRQHERVYRVGHVFCGIGAGAKGFNDAEPRVGSLSARFECAGGIDNDAGAIRNFERITGTPGTVLDLFDREQFEAFHGRPPAPDWREAGPDDVRQAFGNRPLDVVFITAPCKGFSGLLSSKVAGTDKYEALNRLTIRGVWLTLEAFKDHPPAVILFENVPRIATRGRALLSKIKALLQHYGYVVVESAHDCGEIGGLAQSRKRFLLVARRVERVPNYVYEPVKHNLRGVGEVIGALPLPGDPAAGAMHRVPELQWKTWVRLAFVPAGKDWRALNELAVQDGMLRDWGIVPELPLRDNALGVNRWEDSAPTLTAQRSPGQGRFSVADPRPQDATWNNETLGVRAWEDTARVVAGASRPMNGAHSVADTRATQDNQSYGQYGVREWQETAGTVTGQSAPGGGPNSVADPRIPGKPRFNNTFRIVPFDGVAPAVAGPGGPAGGLAVADPRADGGFGGKGKYRVTGMGEPSGAVLAASTTGQGAFALADPRGGPGPNKLHGKHRVEEWDAPSRAVIAGRDNGASAVADPRPTHGPNAHQNKHKVVGFDDPAPTVTGSDRVGSGALSVADPRPGYPNGTHQNILSVADFDKPAKSVTGAKHAAGGALSVADPRPGYKDAHHNVLRVTPYDEPAGTVTSGHGPTTGAISVADPRPAGLSDPTRDERHSYNTQAHYGVVPWDSTSNAVPGYAKYDRGSWSVADPRDMEAQPIAELPEPTQRLVARIIARDGTWHRPFTTLELAALQSIFDPGEVFELEGRSDQVKREWIGNAVPSKAARGMAETVGETLLRADSGQTFVLSSRAIWVKPLALELAVDPRQFTDALDASL